jgi:hopene-associated glycosyltransferase HpnB
MTVLALISLLAWLYLVLLHGRFWQAGPVLAPACPARAPDVAVIVPARDEAEVIARAIGSLLAQDYEGELRIVLVDDGSADGTAAIARALPDPQGRLTVIEGAARPPGWAGKLWAVSQGVTASIGEIILLTDADIVHDPRHVATLVSGMEQGGLDLVSEMVTLNRESLAERWLVPAFVYFFQLLYPFAWANNPRRRTAAGAGGTVLVRRAALERIGGSGAIRGALIDDVALATVVKRGGGKTWIGHSTLAHSIRPYPHFADIWRMIARSAYVQLRRSPALLVLAVLGLALVFLVPPLATLFAHHWTRAAGLGAWLLMALSFLPTLRRFGASRFWAPLVPLMALFYIAATIGSAIDHHRGRGVVWKRRAYTERQA